MNTEQLPDLVKPKPMVPGHIARALTADLDMARQGLIRTEELSGASVSDLSVTGMATVLCEGHTVSDVLMQAARFAAANARVRVQFMNWAEVPLSHPAAQPEYRLTIGVTYPDPDSGDHRFTPHTPQP